ncbi:MAG TPA: hypothetical protein PLY93_01655 [Turneriella sp.]|nr:hypothetical protein [Turneriella sp.]
MQNKLEQFAVGLTALHAALPEEFVQNSVQKFAKKLFQRIGGQAPQSL